MDKRSIILTSEEWDRLIEILDSQHVQHPDTPYLLSRIHNQLFYTVADIPPLFPTPSHQEVKVFKENEEPETYPLPDDYLKL